MKRLLLLSCTVLLFTGCSEEESPSVDGGGNGGGDGPLYRLLKVSWVAAQPAPTELSHDIKYSYNSGGCVVGWEKYGNQKSPAKLRAKQEISVDVSCRPMTAAGHDTESGTLEEKRREERVYDGDGLLTKKVVHTPDSSGVFQKSWVTDLMHDSLGRLLERKETQHGSAGVAPYSLTSYNYTGAGITALLSSWDKKSSNWTETNRVLVTLDQGRVVKLVNQKKSSGTYKDNSSTKYSYDAAGYLATTELSRAGQVIARYEYSHKKGLLQKVKMHYDPARKGTLIPGSEGTFSYSGESWKLPLQSLKTGNPYHAADPGALRTLACSEGAGLP